MLDLSGPDSQAILAGPPTTLLLGRKGRLSLAGAGMAEAPAENTPTAATDTTNAATAPLVILGRQRKGRQVHRDAKWSAPARSGFETETLLERWAPLEPAFPS